jgi:uncharacterized protein YqeY
MSLLKEKVQKNVSEAMKAKNVARLSTLRLMFNAIRKKEIDERKDLSDGEIEKAFLTMSKQIQETIDQAKTAGRADSVAEAEAELLVVREFLPQALGAAEVERIVKDIVSDLKKGGTLPAGNAAMGAVMKQVMAAVGSRADGKTIQGAVKKALET